jgi:UDP-N-acetylmuramoyl-L-alanyl-D-glutamate--2,6-diaminopimelate ligase
VLLSELLSSAPPIAVTGFAIDHRKIAPGAVFGAFEGTRVNGEDFIPAAIAAGAVAVVARRQARVEGVVHLSSDTLSPRAYFAQLAARFFEPLPATRVAVTGTNGKTSTVELTRQLWTLAGRRAASIGTLGVTVGDDRRATGLTTPDVVTFLSNLGGLAREGVDAVAFEASSHGLHQSRIGGFSVAAAAFTNLSRDHLDYHGTMEAYFEAKMILFRELLADGGTAVVWADDAWSERVIALLAAERPGVRVLTVGECGADWTLIAREPTALGQVLRLRADGVERAVKLPLIGAYQAANALVGAALTVATGGEPAQTLQHLERLTPIRGRLERAVLTRAGAPVYVDYAHTPDALEAAIAALKPHASGRIILVFGAGGDRDQGKRGPMGAVAASHADVAIVTDDNPRSEDPATIRAAIVLAAPGAHEIGDRRAAIRAAIAEARAGDIVLIAGKGHEKGQIVGNQLLPFDDAEVAREEAAS